MTGLVSTVNRKQLRAARLFLLGTAGGLDNSFTPEGEEQCIGYARGEVWN